MLQLLQQLDATFARLIFVTFVGSGTRALRAMRRERIEQSGYRRPRPIRNAIALHCAKLLALEDTVLFGRTLLVQANARSAVLQSDAQLQRSAAGAAAESCVVFASTDYPTKKCAAPPRRPGWRCASTNCAASPKRWAAIRRSWKLHAFDAQWSEHCCYKSQPPPFAETADRRTAR